MKVLVRSLLHSVENTFSFRLVFVCIVCAALASGCGFVLNPNDLNSTAIQISSTQEHVSFDDMFYDTKMGKLLVPADGTGQLALIDPVGLTVRYISGFSRVDPDTQSQVGTTSAIVVQGLIYALDQGTLKIDVVDPNTGKLLGSAPLADPPDYIRFVSATSELWVTSKANGRIEVFSLPLSANPPIPKHSGFINVPNGPEALVIDSARGVAYTNQPNLGTTAVIQVQTHNIIDKWGNGCSQARGMALDNEDGLLFIACKEGKLVVLDATQGGVQVTSQNYGAGLDFVAYNPHLHHIYLASGANAILAIFGIDNIVVPTPTPSGPVTPSPAPTPGPSPTPTTQITLTRLGTADTAAKSKCVQTDDHDDIWVCNPNTGQLLLIKDTFPPDGIGF